MKSRLAEERLARLWKRGCDFLECRHAIMGGAMSWLSERNLVAAISNAGGFGVIACGSMSVAQLQTEIAATQKLTDRAFGVNLITMHPDLERLIDACIELGVGHVVLAGGVAPLSFVGTTVPPASGAGSMCGKRTSPRRSTGSVVS